MMKRIVCTLTVLAMVTLTPPRIYATNVAFEQELAPNDPLYQRPVIVT